MKATNEIIVIYILYIPNYFELFMSGRIPKRVLGARRNVNNGGGMKKAGLAPSIGILSTFSKMYSNRGKSTLIRKVRDNINNILYELLTFLTLKLKPLTRLNVAKIKILAIKTAVKSSTKVKPASALFFFIIYGLPHGAVQGGDDWLEVEPTFTWFTKSLSNLTLFPS